MNLKELLAEWEDYDIAQYYLACSLGIMNYDQDFSKEYKKVKGVFWINNKVGNMLYNILESMVEGELLETNDDGMFRWNKSFKGYWENGKHGLS